MPHTIRKKGESGFYHIVSKGSGNQVVFEESQDRRKYLTLLEKAADENSIAVHSYCLMSNHIHLLVRDQADNLSAFMKQLTEAYAMYFAKKIGRVGNVFQRPFWSEAIDSDEYFICALRYIHANPAVAGISTIARYAWSSYGAYLGTPSFVETSFALEMVGGLEPFERLSLSGAVLALPFPNSKLQRHLQPDELWRIAVELVGKEVLAEIRTMKPKQRQPYIAILRDAGFTEREICRVTGLGKNTIHRSFEKM